jgi:hypothetical protein
MYPGIGQSMNGSTIKHDSKHSLFFSMPKCVIQQAAGYLPPMMENQNGDAGLFILPPVSLEG